MTDQLAKANAAIASGDGDSAGHYMRGAAIAARMDNADWWSYQGEKSMGDIGAVVESMGALGTLDGFRKAISAKKTDVGYVSTRKPMPKLKFPDADPELKSPYTGKSYRDFRASGQMRSDELMSEMATAHRMSPDAYLKQLSQAGINKITGAYKRAHWEEQLADERDEWIEKWKESFLDYVPEDEGAPSSEDEVPF